MSEDATTKPTIETVLEKIAELRDAVLDFRQSTDTRFTSVETRLMAIEADVVEMKADIAMIKEEQKRQVLQMDLLTKDMHRFATDLYDLRYEYHKSTQ
jgi:hypothetical protein